MSSTTTRRVSAVLALTVLLAGPVSAATAAGTAVRGQGPTAPTLVFFEQAWRFVTDLLGLPNGAAPATVPGRHGLTARHADLGGFIDPDGARLLNQTTVNTVVTP